MSFTDIAHAVLVLLVLSRDEYRSSRLREYLAIQVIQVSGPRQEPSLLRLDKFGSQPSKVLVHGSVSARFLSPNASVELADQALGAEYSELRLTGLWRRGVTRKATRSNA